MYYSKYKYILIYLKYLGYRTLPVFPIFCTLFCQLEMEIVGLILHFLLLNSNLEWHTFYSTFWIPTFLTKVWFSRVFSIIALESCWISSLQKFVAILVSWIKTQLNFFHWYLLQKLNIFCLFSLYFICFEKLDCFVAQ